MNYRHLFANGKIGSLVLKNRVVMPAMGTSMAGPNGEITEQQIAYYEERAKGGTGLIITEYTSIDYESGKQIIISQGSMEICLCQGFIDWLML